MKIVKWKLAVLVWLAVFPTVNLLIILLDRLFGGIPFYVKTAIMTMILVPLMVYVLLPFITKKFQSWLAR